MTQVEGGGVPAGTELNGIYEIEKRVAIGGMGEVYIGRLIQTGDKVAIKMILPEHAHNELILDLFRKEASTLHGLYHEAIVRYYVFSVDPVLGRPYLAMEYAEGPALGDRIKSYPLSESEMAVLVPRIAGGLHAAHKAGIVHRDLSPDNIILVDNDVDRAKIIDFGIAKAQGSEGTLIGSGFAGKLKYVSPEQLGLAGGEVTAQSDIYSLGLVLAEAAVGYPLDMGGSQVEVIEKRRAVPDLTTVPEYIRPLIASMLQPEPADRPATMAEVADWTPVPTSAPARAARHPRERAVAEEGSRGGGGLKLLGVLLAGTAVAAAAAFYVMTDGGDPKGGNETVAAKDATTELRPVATKPEEGAAAGSNGTGGTALTPLPNGSESAGGETETSISISSSSDGSDDQTASTTEASTADNTVPSKDQSADRETETSGTVSTTPASDDQIKTSASQDTSSSDTERASGAGSTDTDSIKNTVDASSPTASAGTGAEGKDTTAATGGETATSVPPAAGTTDVASSTEKPADGETTSTGLTPVDRSSDDAPASTDSATPTPVTPSGDGGLTPVTPSDAPPTTTASTGLTPVPPVAKDEASPTASDDERLASTGASDNATETTTGSNLAEPQVSTSAPSGLSPADRMSTSGTPTGTDSDGSGRSDAAAPRLDTALTPVGPSLSTRPVDESEKDPANDLAEPSVDTKLPTQDLSAPTTTAAATPAAPATSDSGFALPRTGSNTGAPSAPAAPGDDTSRLAAVAKPDNQPPTIRNRAPSTLSADQGEPLSVRLGEFFDEDGAQNLQLRIQGDVPNGLNITMGRDGVATLTGTPAEYGDYELKIAAVDSDGLLSQSISVRLEVERPTANRDVRDYILAYDGGECFLSRAVELGPQLAKVEVFAAESEIPKVIAFDEDFKAANGFEARIGMRPISPDQCTLVKVLNQVGPQALDNSLVINLIEDQLARGDQLAGKIQGGEGARLFLFDNLAGISDLSEYVETRGGETGFELQISGNGPQILIAARPREGSGLGPEASLNQLLAAAQKGTASLALGFFILK